MQNTLLRTTMLLGITSFILGCAVNETASVTINDDGTVQQLIESNSGVLSSSLSIVETKTTFAGDLLKAQVSIRNDSRSDLEFHYKFKWLDKSDFEVAIDGRPWTPISITPYESKTVQAVAPNSSVNSFKIMVQD